MTRILVVEDETTILENIVETLRLEGFEVHGVEDGIEAVQIAQTFLPNLVVCDVMMPGLDGFGVLIELRSDSRTAQIPFMFLTARAEREDMRRGMELGADDYIIKPFTTSELLAAVNARLDRHETITRQYAERMDSLRHNIVRALPHELRTPLTGIIGYAEMLLASTDDMGQDQIRRMLQVIYKSGMRLHRLIENYLVYAQIELMTIDDNRARALREGQTDIPGVIIGQVAADKAMNASRTADVHTHVQDSPVQIGAENLRKLVDELMDNALKFSEEGTPVEVHAGEHDGRYVISIRDRGRGMKAEDLQSIGAYMQFERKLYEQQGLGLGLIIAKRLAELHNGSLNLTSAVNQGTTVRVALPLAF